jgi:hypothetical protein
LRLDGRGIGALELRVDRGRLPAHGAGHGYSPLFNSTPVLRDGLLAEGAPARDYLMAWVSVPDLTVTPSRQRYEPLGREGDLTIVRYTNLDSGYTAKVSFDGDGFVVEYEDFLKRIAVDRLPAAGIDT